MTVTVKDCGERHLYLEEVRSGWMIGRPSGWSVARQLTREEAEAMLYDAGYGLTAVLASGYEHWEKRFG
jgi:hypothetical protein